MTLEKVQNLAADYARGNHVEGWLTPSASRIVVELARIIGVNGRPACEIGVHHGKLTILLGLLTGGVVVGIDLFEKQDENIDDSGFGNKNIFLRNAAEFGLGPDKTIAISRNSRTLTSEEVVRLCGGAPVLFSVDGGHNEGLTFNDLCIAADAVAEDGVVMLDDVFNANFPGVASGFFRFLGVRPGRLYPFCIGGGKLFLARSGDRADELQAALAAFASSDRGSFDRTRTASFAGRDVLVILERPREQTLRRRLTDLRLWRAVRRTPIGFAIRTGYASSRYAVVKTRRSLSGLGRRMTSVQERLE